ncbi:hypothetical protein BDZ97DRAFT_1385347 [Flammula alnicola]|nr:hypothetical protein BDZ97DRAFT_1385347 [Flammula alnicola]
MEDPLSQYGKNMQDVMKFIDDTQWRGQKPMGPLGIFVRLENADYWNVMRQHIGKLLLSFAVTDSRDIGPLRAILKRTKNFDTRILVSSGDLFDYSQGEPPAQYLTALRLLKISNPWVTRLLIDHAGIERIYVAPTRKEAEEILKERGDGVALSGMGHKLTRWRIDGGNKSEAIRELPVKDPRSSLFRQQINQSDEIEKMIRRGKELQLAIDSLQLSENRLDEQMRGMQERSSQFQATGRALDAEIRREEEELRLKLEEDQADSPVTLAVLEQLKEEKESEKESFAEQLAHVSSQKRDMAPHVMALQRKVDALKGDAEASEEKRQQIVAELATEAGALAQAHKDKQHYEDKKTAEQGKLVGLRVVADEITAAFTELDGKASGFSEREVTTRSSQAVELEITNLNNTLSRYEARQAKSSAQLERELEVVKKVHDDHVKLWNMLWKIYEALQQAIQSRRDKWFKFLAYFSASCKAQFMYHLSSRGYFGQVQFKHIEQRLELRVQKDDQAYERHEETQEADNRRKKDPASLSGGEKSLATLCLLLSMWDVGSIPIRCLDEFDVYMDNQNRRCCIKMLTDAAKSSAGRQTIIITPQSIDNVFSEPPVVLIKQMADPRASTIP